MKKADIQKIKIDTDPRVQKMVNSCFERMDEESMKEVLSGYENDIKSLHADITRECYTLLYNGRRADGDTVYDALTNVNDSIEETFRVLDIAYFINAVFGEEVLMNWHHLEWAKLANTKDFIAILASRDHGKSVEINELVRMSDGSLVEAKDIKVGDKLMGADGTPREVTASRRGFDDNMYKVGQYRGEDYTVNSRHTLTLLKKVKHYNKRKVVGYHYEVVDIDIEDYLALSEHKRKTQYYGFKARYDLPEQSLPIEPYFLGIWLGDGTSVNQMVTKPDVEIGEYIRGYANSLGLGYSYNEKTWGHCIKRADNHPDTKNPLLDVMRDINLINNKHIPKQYMKGSERQRLELLAGIIDTDGNKHEGCYYISMNNENLVKQIQHLAWSLGFHAGFKKKVSRLEWLKREDKNYESWIVTITGDLSRIPCKIKRKKVEFKVKANHKPIPEIEGYKITTKSPLKVTNVGRGEYVSITVDGDKRFLLGDNTVTHNSFFWTELFSCWKMYGYDSNQPNTKMNQKGFFFSNNDEKAAHFLGLIKERIMFNEVLRDRLFLTQRDFKTNKLTAKNGATLDCKGFMGSARGHHPFWIVVDDPLTDQTIYSASYREKAIDYFYSVVMNMLVPHGQLALIGTPFHAQDIYSTFREPKKLLSWTYREYPAIFPDGQVLWSDRYSYEQLKTKRTNLGAQIFGREFLLKPVTSDTSLFPWKMINPSIAGMENFRLVNNVEAFPVGFQKIVLSADFAKSANVGSDATWMGVWGIDSQDKMWLIHSWRKVGATFNEQIAKIKQLHQDFRFDIGVLEANNFQKIYVEYLEDTGIPIVPHVTSSNKTKIEDGVPSMAVMFERLQFRFPYGDEHSKNTADLLLSEFSSMSYTDKGIQGVGAHDDGVMMTWFGTKGKNYQGGGFAFDFM